MHRSRRKNPFRAITKNVDTEKQDKRAYNRRFRHAAEQALKVDSTGESLPVLCEHRDLWSVDKVGKIRFDPVKYPKLTRK